MSIINIRTATIDDIPTLAQLWQDKVTLLEQSDAFFSPLDDGLSRWSTAAVDWLDDGRAALRVGEAGGQIAGYIAGRIQNSPPGLSPEQYGDVMELVLDLHTYHGGLGRQLVQSLFTWFGDHGVSHAVIPVTSTFAVEQAFWRSLGAIRRLDGMVMSI